MHEIARDFDIDWAAIAQQCCKGSIPFPVLGLRPAAGRLLTPEDDRAIGANFVVVLSHGYWLSHLGGDPAVINSSIIVNGQSMTIVGIAPEGFDGTTTGRRPVVYVPLSMRAQMAPGWNNFEDRRSYWATSSPDGSPNSLDQANAAINAIYSPIINDVEAPLQVGIGHPTMVQFRAKKVGVEDDRRGQSEVHTSSRTPMLMLFAITGIVLLTACANIANLLLARAAGRSLEMSVRLSLGATRRHLLAQLLTESLLLAVMGDVRACWWRSRTMIAFARMLRAARGLAPSRAERHHHALRGRDRGDRPRVRTLPRPPQHPARPHGWHPRQRGQITGARSAARFRTSLATAQIALSITLLISAGLFLRSLVNVSKVDLGLAAGRPA